MGSLVKHWPIQFSLKYALADPREKEEMGTLFQHIADDALVAEDASYYTHCHVCEKQNVAVYKAMGFILREDATYDDEDPDAEVYVACAECIQAEKIARFGEWEMDDFLKDNYENWQELRRELRMTPQIPCMMQSSDWVICCGMICEFTGSPKTYEELVVYTEKAKYWHRGKDEYRRNFRSQGPPEELDEVSKFRCGRCEREYWIDQYT